MLRRPEGMQWKHFLNFRNLLFLDTKCVRVISCIMTQGTLFCSAPKSFDGPSRTFLAIDVNAGKCLHECQMALWGQFRNLLLSLGVGESEKGLRAAFSAMAYCCRCRRGMHAYPPWSHVCGALYSIATHSLSLSYDKVMPAERLLHL